MQTGPGGAQPAHASYPLSGIAVLDLSHIYNGPYAAFLMAFKADGDI